MSETKPETDVVGENAPKDGSVVSEDDQIQVSDRAILDLMRSGSSVTVGWLSKRLQVTDTAIRQRLTRLMDRGQVVRSSQREGRGRPKHLYRITDLGVRQCGANLEDLAVALWNEVLNLPNAQVRQTIIEGVVARLADQYTPEIQGNSPAERSQQVVELFNRRNVSFAFDSNKGDGRFSVLGCPYPGLSEHDKQICSMEHALFQRLIGLPLERLSEGRDGCHCQFVPAGISQPALNPTLCNPQASASNQIHTPQISGSPSNGFGNNIPTQGRSSSGNASPSLMSGSMPSFGGCGQHCGCHHQQTQPSQGLQPNNGEGQSGFGQNNSSQNTPDQFTEGQFGKANQLPNQNDSGKS